MKPLRQENPRTRFLNAGKSAMMTYELIALLIQRHDGDDEAIDLAKQLHTRFKSIHGIRKASLYDLMQIRGMGPVKAMQLLTALELGKRLNQETLKKTHFLGSPHKVYDFLKDDLEPLDQEHFVVLYLNTKGYLIETVELFKGSLNASLVHQREIFKHAVAMRAASFIMVHNHPSGDATPSGNDKRVTGVMEDAGTMMDILMTDHIIIGHQQFYSFKAEQITHIHPSLESAQSTRKKAA